MSEHEHDPLRLYNSFYGRGGWVYDEARERSMLALIAERAGWRPGDRVVEIGAGLGEHSELLRQMGYDVTAVELSPVGCDAARDRYPELHVVCASVTSWKPRYKGHIFARGMSFYHYELAGVNCQGIDVPAETARMMRLWVRVGSTFVLQIATDFTGRRPHPHVHHNAAEDYEGLFSPHGQVDLYDWQGVRVDEGGRRQGVICVTRKARKARKP